MEEGIDATEVSRWLSGDPSRGGLAVRNAAVPEPGPAIYEPLLRWFVEAGVRLCCWLFEGGPKSLAVITNGCP